MGKEIKILVNDSFVKVMTKENNKSIQFEYEYKIVSSSSVLYLIPLDYSKLNLYIDGKKIEGNIDSENGVMVEPDVDSLVDGIYRLAKDKVLQNKILYIKI